MSLLTIAMLAVLTLGGLRGLLKGLIKEIASLTAVVAGGWLAYHHHEAMALPISEFMPLHAARITAFIGLLLTTGICAHLLGNLLTTLMKLALLGWVNRLGGLIIGCLEGALVLGMLLHAVVSAPLKLPIKEQIKNDFHATALANLGATVLQQTKALGVMKKP